MIFETHCPDGPHADLIESVFHFKHFQPDHSIERVVPTGHVFLLFELDGFVRHTYDNDTLEPNANFTRAWVSGPHKNYLSISAHDDSEMFVIQFKPWGARPFLHLELHRIADQVVPAEHFEALEIDALRDTLFAAPDSADKFAVADRWLGQQFDASLSPPDFVRACATLLAETPAAKLNDVMRSLGTSQKHLIDQFKKFVGLTPKQYQRILRFNDVFREMQGDQFLSWSDIAYRCGYSDQSHFIREFRSFSGFNPESFLKADFDTDTPNFFPLDRDESRGG